MNYLLCSLYSLLSVRFTIFFFKEKKKFKIKLKCSLDEYTVEHRLSSRERNFLTIGGFQLLHVYSNLYDLTVVLS